MSKLILRVFQAWHVCNYSREEKKLFFRALVKSEKLSEQEEMLLSKRDLGEEINFLKCNPYEPLCPSVGRSVGWLVRAARRSVYISIWRSHHFLKEREVTHPCSYRVAYSLKNNVQCTSIFYQVHREYVICTWKQFNKQELRMQKSDTYECPYQIVLLGVFVLSTWLCIVQGNPSRLKQR